MVLCLGVSEERNVYNMINFEVLMGMSEGVERESQTEAVVKIARSKVTCQARVQIREGC